MSNGRCSGAAWPTGLFDPEGVTAAYRRLQSWAHEHGDRSLLLMTYTRLTTMLGLLGQQRESNEQLRELLDALAPQAGALGISRVLVDLTERRANITVWTSSPQLDTGNPIRRRPCRLPILSPMCSNSWNPCMRCSPCSITAGPCWCKGN